MLEIYLFLKQRHSYMQSGRTHEVKTTRHVKELEPKLHAARGVKAVDVDLLDNGKVGAEATVFKYLRHSQEQETFDFLSVFTRTVLVPIVYSLSKIIYTISHAFQI